MYLIGITLLFLALRAPFMGLPQRWDAATYFYGLQNAYSSITHANNLTSFLKSIVLGLNWYGHPTFGYGLLTIPSQIFHSGSPIWINLMNNLLAVTAIIAFYFLVKYFQPKKKVETLLATILFAANPLFWGLSFSFGPDFGILYFYLCFAVASLYKREWLSLLFAILLVTTKETGFVIYFAHQATTLLLKKWSREKIPLSYWWKIFLPIVVFAANYYLRKFSYWSYASFSCEGKEKFCVGLSKYNIYQVLGVVFVISFQWINYLVVLIGFKKITKHLPSLLPIIVTFGSILVFHLFFITNVVPRYTAISIISATLLASLIIGEVRKKQLRIFLFLLIIVLNFLSVFRTIDPISKNYFGTIKIGERQILKIGMSYLGDGMVYNMEYTMIDRLLARFYQMVVLKPEDVVMLNDDRWAAWVDGWGPYVARVDAIKLSPTMMRHNSFVPVATQASIIDPNNLHRNPYFVNMNWLDDNTLDKLKDHYKVDWGKRIDIEGYYIDVYKLKSDK